MRGSAILQKMFAVALEGDAVGPAKVVVGITGFFTASATSFSRYIEERPRVAGMEDVARVP